MNKLEIVPSVWSDSAVRWKASLKPSNRNISMCVHSWYWEIVQAFLYIFYRPCTIPILDGKYYEHGGFPGGAVVKNPPANAVDAELWVWSLGKDDPLEKEMATHSNILAWKIPWTEEPGGL